LRKPRKQKEDQVSDKLKEKAVGASDTAPVGAKDSVKRSVAKSSTAPTGAKDSAPVGAKDTAPVGAKDGTLGAKD